MCLQKRTHHILSSAHIRLMDQFIGLNDFRLSIEVRFQNYINTNSVLVETAGYGILRIVDSYRDAIFLVTLDPFPQKRNR